MERCWEVGGGGAEAHKPVPAPFLTKTYQLVDDPSTDHIVSWGDDRVSTFVVWRPPEFARDLLPNYFKHDNFSSFVRQLNTYGFRKVVPERWEFANEFFRKGEKHLLCQIHRRKTSASSAMPLPSSPPLFQGIYPHHYFEDHRHIVGPVAASRWHDATASSSRLLVLGTGAERDPNVGSVGSGGAAGGAPVTMAAMVEENERLRRREASLLAELAHMQKLYNGIIYFVQNHVQPVSPSYATSANLILSASGCQQRGAARNSGGSTTSSSSLTVVEEPSPPPLEARNKNSTSNGESSSNTSARPKLFGFPLKGACSNAAPGGSKRGWLVEHEPSSPSTKPRLGFADDLGLSLMPPSPC